MPTTLTPTPPVRFALYRLRQAVAESSRFQDEELLAILNEGYRSACQRSQCLQAVVTLTFDPGLFEIALPDDWSSTLRVYVGGVALEPAPYRHSTMTLPGTYYQIEGKIGLNPADADPDAGVDAVFFYARTPDDLGYDDTPEWGPEWNYLLRHYAAWRCILASGGAQTIGKAVQERRLFENGVRQLRWQNRPGASGSARRLRHISETRVAPVAG